MSEQLPSLSGSRPILSLKNRPRPEARRTSSSQTPPAKPALTSVPAPTAALDPTPRRGIRPVARWSNDYMSQMQAEMDALR
ncbi:MAG TPA: hypothetical protein VHZ53_15670 [Steroidobacteraceae bacterium]|jgi:hypothetical protein|nr:hypothetical protein [Steroidobacteraceae bacterium]